MRDPVAELRNTLIAALDDHDVHADQPLSGAPWSPHLYDASTKTAWHCLAQRPSSDFWVKRMVKAREAIPGLRLGICLPGSALGEDILEIADELSAEFALVADESEKPEIDLYTLAADLIYQQRIILSHAVASNLLNRWLDRCATEKDNNRKGVMLEVLTALLLSQVSGFEVRSRGVSNRSQQIDVQVHNRNVGGILGDAGPVVIAEAKNWTKPVGPQQYDVFYRKVETRFNRSRLGIFVTTDHFTSGVDYEMQRDSKGSIAVVALDKESLPAMWRKGSDITGNMEAAIIDATNT